MDRDGARIVRILTGRGLLLGVELVTVRDSKTPTTDAAEEIFSRALEVASASKPPWATSWIEHLSGIDAVYGSQHRHRDVPNWGVVNWAENVSYWLQADIQSPEIEVRLSPNRRHSAALHAAQLDARCHAAAISQFPNRNGHG